MFAQDQVNQFQAQLKQTLADAQKKAQERAKEFEAEAKKLVDLVGDRAQAELKSFLGQAQVSTRDQVFNLGAELVKFGQRLQEMAKAAGTAAPGAAPTETTPKTEGEKIAAADPVQPDTSVN